VKLRPGGWAWVGLAGYVAIADTILIKSGKETMSTVFGDALKSPASRWPVILVWLIITLHLFGNYIPSWLKWLRSFDPISGLAHVIDR